MTKITVVEKCFIKKFKTKLVSKTIDKVLFQGKTPLFLNRKRKSDFSFILSSELLQSLEFS